MVVNKKSLKNLRPRSSKGEVLRSETMSARLTPDAKKKASDWLEQQGKSLGDLLEDIANGRVEIKFLDSH